MSLPLGDILAKLASGETLSRGEIEAVRLQMNNVQSTVDKFGGWIGADGSLSVPYLKVGQSDFDIMPMGTIRLVATSQSIPNDAITPITFTTGPTVITGPYLTWSLSDPTKILLKINLGGRIFMIFGTADFAANATGRRAIALEQYDASNAKIGSVTMASFVPADGSDPATIPFASTDYMNATTTYLKVSVVQESGGALNMTYVRLSIAIMR